MNNNDVLFGLFGLTFVSYLYYSLTEPNSNTEQKKVLKKPEKYVIFLDIDGTVTQLSGEHPNSLFNLFIVNPYTLWVKPPKQNVRTTLFESDEKFNKVKNFINMLSTIDKSDIEIILVTNNFLNAIYQLWTQGLGCPWERLDSRSAFRESGPENKLTLIRKIIDENKQQFAEGKWKAIYFEDDEKYVKLQEENFTLPSELKIVNCANNMWLGNRLPDLTDKNSLFKYLETL